MCVCVCGGGGGGGGAGGVRGRGGYFPEWDLVFNFTFHDWLLWTIRFYISRIEPELSLCQQNF